MVGVVDIGKDEVWDVVEVEVEDEDGDETTFATVITGISNQIYMIFLLYIKTVDKKMKIKNRDIEKKIELKKNRFFSWV
jgi:hypothetical protein